MKWFLDRFRYAFAGVRYGIVKDRSVRFQFIFAVAAVLLSALLRLSVHEWLWILLSITLVVVSEIFNSCLEKTVDYISLDRCDQARLIKDMAAGAVLLCSIFALICGLVIFIPHVIHDIDCFLH